MLNKSIEITQTITNKTNIALILQKGLEAFDIYVDIDSDSLEVTSGRKPKTIELSFKGTASSKSVDKTNPYAFDVNSIPTSIKLGKTEINNEFEPVYTEPTPSVVEVEEEPIIVSRSIEEFVKDEVTKNETTEKDKEKDKEEVIDTGFTEDTDTESTIEDTVLPVTEKVKTENPTTKKEIEAASLNDEDEDEDSDFEFCDFSFEDSNS